MRVGLAFDLKQSIAAKTNAPEDELEEYDSPATIGYIKHALESAGHTTVELKGGLQFLQNVQQEKVDIVFNISEGLGTFRSREAQVPSILEMLEIPYTGSDPQCLAVALDKHLTKKIVSIEGVATPYWVTVANQKELANVNFLGFPFPAIVKPDFEGSSKGVHNASLVEGPNEAMAVAEEMLKTYCQPVIIEEFIDGDEITVGVIGNAAPRIIGMMRILPRKQKDKFVYSVEVKRDWRNLVDYESPVNLDTKILKQIEIDALRTYKILGCRDFARVDFRINKEGRPYLLEINPLPGLGDYSDLVIMALKLGWTHDSLIIGVLNAALERYPSCVRV